MSSGGISLATQQLRLSLAQYYSVGSLSVLIWDILYNLENDYDLIRTHGLDLASFVYLISRASTLAFVSITTTLLTTPLNHCHRYGFAEVAFFVIFTASTLFLSYIRVCAVWKRSMTIVIVFGVLWLVSLGASLTTVRGLTLFEFGQLCLPLTAGNYVAAAVLVPTFNHILVFSTITYGLCRSRSQASILDFRKGYQLYILGDTLPTFSKAILQSSQLCYLVVVVVGVLTMGWFFGYSSDQSYRISIYIPYVTIVNIMFSWVFRKAKLGVFTIIAPINDVPSSAIGLQSMRNAQLSSVFRPAGVFMPNKDLDSKNDELQTPPDRYNIQINSNASSPIRIGVEEVVEFVSDEPDSKGKRSNSLENTIHRG